MAFITSHECAGPWGDTASVLFSSEMPADRLLLVASRRVIRYDQPDRGTPIGASQACARPAQGALCATLRVRLALVLVADTAAM
jgi:hypothetical protein